MKTDKNSTVYEDRQKQYCTRRQTNNSTLHEDRQMTVLYMKTDK